jgi:hypothetical protein
MHRHPLFDLWLHDDAELGAVIGSPVTLRMTIHEWPLSCVQGVEFATGERLIYKAQSPPTVEPEFYDSARAPILVPARNVPNGHGPDGLLLEEVRAPRLCDVQLSEATAVKLVDDVVAHIGRIDGELPTIGDIRTQSQWQATLAAIAGDLRVLAMDAELPLVTDELVEKVSRVGNSAPVAAALDTPNGFVHRGLTADCVLVASDGYRVLDWQRPIWGPTELDRASLLESLGFDAAAHMPEGLIQLRAILEIGWFAESACRWFPAPSVPWLTEEIARVADQLSPP